MNVGSCIPIVGFSWLDESTMNNVRLNQSCPQTVGSPRAEDRTQQNLPRRPTIAASGASSHLASQQRHQVNGLHRDYIGIVRMIYCVDRPVHRTRLNPVEANADCTVDRTMSAVRPCVSWKPSCTSAPPTIPTINCVYCTMMTSAHSQQTETMLSSSRLARTPRHLRLTIFRSGRCLRARLRHSASLGPSRYRLSIE